MKKRMYEDVSGVVNLISPEQSKMIIVTAIGSKIGVVKSIKMHPFIKKVANSGVHKLEYRGIDNPLNNFDVIRFNVEVEKDIVLEPDRSTSTGNIALKINYDDVSIPLICNGRFCIEVVPSQKKASIEHLDVVNSYEVPCILDIVE